VRKQVCVREASSVTPCLVVIVSYIVIHGVPPSPQAAKALGSATCFFTARESAEKHKN